MPLIKDNRIVEDSWVSLADDEPVHVGAWPIVGLVRWRAERASLMDLGVPLGIRLNSDQPPRLIAEELEHFALVALAFPKFTDGRAYSYARLLRERYGYAGELRAVGAVLLDQAPFMVRCGFDAFQVPDVTSAAAWRAALRRISVRYQPAADGRSPIRPARPASRPRPAASRPEPAVATPADPCAAVWAY